MYEEMLINFRCSNFRSIRDIQELSMVSSVTKNLPEQITKFENMGILKAALIFGANASGKSNIFKAIRFSRDLIMNLETPDYSPSAQVFKLDQTYLKKGSIFEYEIEIDNRFFKYGFEIMIPEKFKIIGEWLSEIFLDNRKNEIIFIRNNKICNFNENQNTIEATDNELILRKISIDNKNTYKKLECHKIISKVNNWFWNSLAVIKPTGSLRWTFDYKNEEKLQELKRILSAFDTGINNFEFIEHKTGEEDLKPIYNIRTKYNDDMMMNDRTVFIKGEYGRYEVLRGIHGDENVDLLSYDESDGTSRLFDLAPILIDDDKDMTYIVDEIDRCLHPAVTYGFIEWFLKKKYKHHVQLISTTHQTDLMDQELIRRDELWLVQKELDGHSELYSIDNYKVRFDIKLDKSYKEGRFKGRPIIHIPEEINDNLT
jgi:AAA15 family ATPase/GTPase